MAEDMRELEPKCSRCRLQVLGTLHIKKKHAKLWRQNKPQRISAQSAEQPCEALDQLELALGAVLTRQQQSAPHRC